MAGKRKTIVKRNEPVKLDGSGIDRISALTVETLTLTQTNQKDIVRLRLSIEEILAIWQSNLGEDAVCTFRCGTRLGRPYIHILSAGKRVDPNEADAEETGTLLYSTLLAQAGLSMVYTYKNGENCLALYPPKPKRVSPLVQLLLSIGAAVVCGFLCLALPQNFQGGVSSVSSPLFTAMMGLLQTLASPMIFLSVCWGMISIGDVGMLGKIGRTVAVRFLISIYILTTVSALGLVWFFHSGDAAAAQEGNAASQIYNMLLGIIPGNIISPFLEGNSLQIIFMSICTGLVLLVLGEKVPAVSTFVGQANTAIQFMMETVSRYIPVFTFVSLFSLITSNALNGLEAVIKGILLGVLACVIWPILYALAVSVRLKVSFFMLLRKLFPTYLVALTTASSAAALSINLETCQRRLGISSRISSFAVPLGQVIFKPGAAFGFFLMAMGLGECYGVAMPFSWVVTGVLLAGLLAMAAPPIPGGALSCYTVLLTQLGIPSQAIALAVAGNVILDFFMTSCGISCLQSELTLIANRLGMLNTEILKKE